MPCMGPSQQYAYSKGEEFYREVLLPLLQSNGIDTVLKESLFCFPGFIKDQQDKFKQLEDLIKEIFWNQACMDF